MSTGGYRAGIGGASTFADDPGALAQLPARPGAAVPSPFDALDPLRLAGPSGSHPLALVDLPSLLSGPTRGLEGAIEIVAPVTVGGAIGGRLRVRARREIRARSATLRLVGVRLNERSRSASEPVGPPGPGPDRPDGRRGPASATRTVSWVEVHGTIIEELPFTEPALPATLEPGQEVDVPFTIPAPRLGPPTAHAGVAAVAWAVEAQWDIGMAPDERVCAYLPVRQHPDLLRAGVLTLPSGALNDAVIDEDATLSVEPLPPIPGRSSLQVGIAWPGAPSGRSARLELRLEVRGESQLDLVQTSMPVDHQALAQTSVTVPVEADLPPTLQTEGLEVGYALRVTVDRRLRSDVHRERALVIC